ncbi:MAG: hypothetical protein FWH01_01690 [Oscillospiraceae bacterium]|nr:hypothetical protein [Oscillospiraceae bacterium]
MLKIGKSCKTLWRIAHGAHGQQGALTLEAAISLPLYFCILVAIAFLLRAVQVHERVQHAISQASLEIAGASYLYGLSGAPDAPPGAQGLSGLGAESAGGIAIKSAQFVEWLPLGAGDEAFQQLSIASSALTDRISGALFCQYADLVTSKYFNYGTLPALGVEAGPAPGALAGLNIEGGAQGLDYARSSYLSDGGEDVKINVRYAFNVPIPIKPFSRITIEQEACSRAWLFGASQNAAGRGPIWAEDDIWSLHNFERGDRIQEIFHANLPKGFNVLASFNDGVATAIHSIDTTAASYQTPVGIGRVIDGYVGQLRDYQGQPAPYGSAGIVILPEEILVRRLVIVMPRNEISAEISSEIDRCIRDALAQGVILQVERYATKKVNGEKEGE